MKSKASGYIFAILSAVIYGCMPIMAKYIYAEGVNPLTLVFLRNLLALPILALLMIREKKQATYTSRTVVKSVIPAFFGCVITPLLLFSSYNYLDSGISTVFHFIYPCIVLLIGIIFLKKKFDFTTPLSVFICIIGIMLFYDPSQSISAVGSALAFISGLTFAIYVSTLSRFQTGGFSGFTFCFYVAMWSSIILLIVCLVSGQIMLPTTLLGWGLCLLFALSVTVGAVFLFQQGTMIIGGEKSSVLSALEPITSVVIGIIVFGESCRLTVVIGATLVIISSVLIAAADLLKKEKE